MVEIYTDGSARPNPGVGAYSFIVLKDGESLYEYAGIFGDNETNNTMELRAVIEGLRYVKSQFMDDAIYVYTDSQYVQQGIDTYIHDWMENNWMTKAGKPVKNRELWEELHDLRHNKTYFHWLRGHRDNKWNNLADEMARKALDT